VEREELQNLFLLLCPELQDQDIPHHTTTHKHIIETYEALQALSQDIQVYLYFFLYDDWLTVV